MNAGQGTTVSKLERVLRAGAFAVTAETTPPLSADGAAVVARAAPLKGLADAVNVTDGAAAKVHMSALAASVLLIQAGIEPVLQFTCRDRNRLALQMDMMGGAALGISNILCLKGDDPKSGDQPDAKAVFDIESRDLIATARAMRDDAKLPSGRQLKPPPHLFIGAADAPHDVAADWRPDALEAKIAAGADFFQTQFAFDIAVLKRYMARIGDAGIPERAFYLVGLGPLTSARAARWMNDNLWGVDIPAPIIARLEGADDERAEGRRICIELIQQMRDIPGIAGVHLMSPRGEEESARVIAESGILGDRVIVAHGKR